MKTDHSIPYANIIMRCDTYIPLSCALPDGYAIRTYKEHDENAWAALKTEEQDFSITEAELYFKKAYLSISVSSDWTKSLSSIQFILSDELQGRNHCHTERSICTRKE